VDAGRPRQRSLGVPVGGAADRASLTIGNALVGNASHALALEFTLAGPTLQADCSMACVVFGAPFALTINGKKATAGMTFSLAPADVLHIGGTEIGVRGYLCVAGGFEAPEVLGSRSSFDPLQTGQMLICAASHCEPRGLGFSSLPSPRWGEGGRRPGEGRILRVLDGPQRDWFPDDRFFTQSYEVSSASNRMGVRLQGEPLTRRPGELVSEAVAPGAVQITNDGLPVMLGVDGQTIGGYPKIAHVIRADLDCLAQLRPGEKVNFVRVSWEEAELAAKERTATLRSWLARLRAAERVPVRD
jgi:antagonist of KipI